MKTYDTATDILAIHPSGATSTQHVSIQHPEHGLFIACYPVVNEYLATYTRRQMIADCHDLFADTFTRKQLAAFPSYFLAVLRNQCC